MQHIDILETTRNQEKFQTYSALGLRSSIEFDKRSIVITVAGAQKKILHEILHLYQRSAFSTEQSVNAWI